MKTHLAVIGNLEQAACGQDSLIRLNCTWVLAGVTCKRCWRTTQYREQANAAGKRKEGTP
jgi:hypothetical protein